MTRMARHLTATRSHMHRPIPFRSCEQAMAATPLRAPPVGSHAAGMTRRFTVEIEHETDGRWIAEIPDLPGAMAYGATREEAIARAEALALRVLAERLESGETKAEPLDLAFVAA